MRIAILLILTGVVQHLAADSVFNKTKALSIALSNNKSYVVGKDFEPVTFKNNNNFSITGFYDRIIVERFHGFSADFKNGATLGSTQFNGFKNTRLMITTQLGLNYLILDKPKAQIILGGGFKSDGIIYNTETKNTIQVGNAEKEAIFNNNFYFFPNYYLNAKYNFMFKDRPLYFSLNYLPSSFRAVKEFDEYLEYDRSNGQKLVKTHLYFTERAQKVEVHFGVYF